MANSVDTLFRKYLSDNIREALSSVSGRGEISKAKIKVARKSIKRVRTILKLLATSLKGGWVKTEEELLKDLSRTFKPLRNLFIAEEVFKEVLPYLKKESPECDFSQVKNLLETLEKEEMEAFHADGEKRKRLVGDLQVAYERLDEMLFKTSPWEPIREGLEETYRSSQKLSKSMTKSPSPSDIIEFRKTVNFLSIELDFLSPYLKSDHKNWGKKVASLSVEAGHLQDVLLVMEILKDNKKRLDESAGRKALIASLEKYQKMKLDVLITLCQEVFIFPSKEFVESVLDGEKIKAEKNSLKEKKTAFLS